MARFVDALAQIVALDSNETAILSAVGVTSWEDLTSLLQSFPSLAQRGLRIPDLSFAAINHVMDGFVQYSAATLLAPPPVTFGALAPADAPVTEGSVVGMPPSVAPAQPAAALANIDLRRQPWPVRNQNPRGTCVAFGATACAELVTGQGAPPDLSEQFLYWAIKTQTADPYPPNQDGTWLEFARDALQTEGICPEALCAYVNAPTIPVSGPRPSAAAVAAAAGATMNVAAYHRNPSQAANLAYNLLAAGRPVAISLPVFGDPGTLNPITNWTTPVSWRYGRVLNPPPTSVVVGGHCVCITGFVADADEPHGGYFVVRNSWDVAWGAQNPAPGYGHAPAPGYGDISASYVEKYCWELFQL